MNLVKVRIGCLKSESTEGKISREAIKDYFASSQAVGAVGQKV